MHESKLYVVADRKTGNERERERERGGGGERERKHKLWRKN